MELGQHRELFVDSYLIDKMDRVQRQLHEPRDEGNVFKFDKPWEGVHCGYCTMLQDGSKMRVYYRGMPLGTLDGTNGEVTCVAESEDGIHWTRPELNLFEVGGSKANNVVWANDAPYSHNFSPFIDTRPDCPREQRYKALSGLDTTGLVAFASPDGLHWTKMRTAAVVPKKAPFKFSWMFDSQNVAFWSASEKKYVCYFRIWNGVRRIARCESQDFLNWSEPVLMEYETDGRPSPIEELYTNQTSPYFRAPQLYVAIAARFVPGRQAISDEEAAALQVAKGYHKDLSDAILMTTRGGNVYDRSFMSCFIRPGIGARNWVSRTNYPALGILQTSPTEMSIYANQDNAQPTAHLHRYSLRLDGFASVHAGYDGGTLLTKLFTFDESERSNQLAAATTTPLHLRLNFSTSAVGSIRVEVQNQHGQAIPGLAASDCVELIGNEVDRTVRWKSGSDLRQLLKAADSSLADSLRVGDRTAIRLRFVMQDADLYALQIAGASDQ
ncbi:MAG: hypothetical protein IT423_01320 [Pirellulaceae bacterium]|nr:hypothetical protein [Pirellulaceae bacterium]